MKQDFILSLFFHIVIFIVVALSNLFFFQTIVINQVNVSLVSSAALDDTSSSYKSLNIDQKDIVKIDDSQKPQQSTSSQKNTDQGADNNTKQAIDNSKDNNQDTVVSNQAQTAAPTAKDDIANKVDDPKAAEEPTNSSPAIPTNNKKADFIKNILTGLDQGNLSKEEIAALNNQIKGCWYGQGGHSTDEDLKVSLTLTMNEDATVADIKINNEESYNTPLRKALLMQVLRALKDPKCKQLRLPISGYSNWRVINIEFDPAE